MTSFSTTRAKKNMNYSYIQKQKDIYYFVYYNIHTLKTYINDESNKYKMYTNTPS